MDAMVERIERLERSVRRFRWAGGAVVCLGVVALVIGQKAEPKDTPKVLEVDKIVAREVVADGYTLMGSGEVRGYWATLGKEAALVMSPPGRNTFPAKGEDPHATGPGLILAVSPERARIRMDTTGDRTSYWTLSKDGVANITLLKNGDKIVGGNWTHVPKVGSCFVLQDEKGTQRAILGHSQTVDKTTGVKTLRPESSLTLMADDGTLLHRVP